MSYALVAVAVVAVVGAGVSAYGASAQATAAKQQADYQAQVNANNAKIAEYQRTDAINRGQDAAEKSLQQQALLLSQQRAALAANGVDLNSGSATDLFASTKFLGAQDVNTIQSNAAREAWGYKNDSANALQDSNLNRWKAATTSPGKQAALAGGTSLLNSASSYASQK
jgi:hypothetical protein